MTEGKSRTIKFVTRDRDAGLPCNPIGKRVNMKLPFPGIVKDVSGREFLSNDIW